MSLGKFFSGSRLAVASSTAATRATTCTLLWLLTVAWPSFADPPTLPALPEYHVMRTSRPPSIDGKLDEPVWFAAPALSDFHFPWYQAGTKEKTLAKIVWDDQYLYIAHLCEDTHITARYRLHNDPIPQDDCMEIMLAPDPDKPLRYFNIEWNVLGGYIDGSRPNGPQSPRVEWDVSGMKIAGSIIGVANDDQEDDESWQVEVAIPFQNFAHAMPHTPPQAGDKWRVNLNRHGGNVNPQYSQWSAGDTPAPAFHVPHRFGTLHFAPTSLPFPSPSSTLSK